MSHAPLFELETRLNRLFQAVVEEYIATAQPVGSQAMVDRQVFAVSSATIRNWFAELDQRGLLMQPHTSGGRVPTEFGWQMYVQRCLEPQSLSKQDQKRLVEAKNSAIDAVRSWKALAKVVADLSGQAVYVSWQFADTYYTGLSQLFIQPEFKDWQRVVNLSEILDRLDEALNQLREASIAEPRALIGPESPFGAVCSTIVCRQGDVLFGLLGPVRMDYRRNTSLLAAVHSLFL